MEMFSSSTIQHFTMEQQSSSYLKEMKIQAKSLRFFHEERSSAHIILIKNTSEKSWKLDACASL